MTGRRWTSAAVVWTAAGALAVAVGGCKQKEAPTSQPAATSPAENTQDDAVLERMRQEAISSVRDNAPPRQPPGRPADAGNPLFPKELFNAAKNGDLEEVKRIMTSSPLVLIVDEQGSTPVHYAASGGHLHVLEHLFGLPGFSPNDVNREGVTALHWAAVSGKRNAVDYLVTRGANVDAKDKQGRTPLFAAAAVGRADVVEYLIMHGADMDAKDSNGVTPLDVAIDRRRGEVVKLLTDLGAKTSGMPTPPTTEPAK